MVRGAIQVPPGGEPVVFLADHPVTGGYPVVATVCDADVDRAAQVRPGQRVRFVVVPSPSTDTPATVRRNLSISTTECG
jgi:allophanate hydrolase subunit 2